MRLSCARGALSLLTAAAVAHGLLTANQTDTYLLLANDRLTAAVNRSSGAVFYLTLDGQDLLGTEVTDVVTPGGATGNGVSGVGPYLDCYCTPEGSYTPGHDNATFTLHRGVDSRNVSYGGIVMSQVYAPTALLLEQYWFLRDGETGLHVFSRIANNHSNASAGVLQELRTLFRPNTDASIWTHLVVDDALWAPLPVPDPAAGNLTDAVTVQDATWDLGAPRGDADPYVAAFSEYFTKYVFSTTWRDQAVHGMYADGTRGADGDAAAAGSTFGSWLVMNTKDTYFGGPTWSDLTVDGIVYNYLVSNHHGNQAPNMTAGLDRTFGPFYYYFNRGSAAAAAAAEGEEGWRALRDDALRLADPAWSAAFYDDIAPLVPGYAPTSGRGGWRATVDVPAGAERPIAVLSASGWDFQDNAQDITAFQYWADVDVETGAVEIDRVRAGAYRLTVYANGIFGSHVQEGVVVEAGVTTEGGRIGWVPEAAGRELWRIGVPDKAGGELLHGDHPDPTHPLHPAEYRTYWAAYDFLSDFPDGVRFHVGRSDEAQDLNYIHWSVFGGYANARRPEQVEGDGSINNWTVAFDARDLLTAEESRAGTATLTVQLAAAKGASGNTDVQNATQAWSDLPYVVVVNGRELETWVIPYYQSSSCAVRSAVSGCYDLSNKWEFPASYLRSGGNATNEIVLSLPYNATDYESALLPRSVYVQYDALRLEVR